MVTPRAGVLVLLLGLCAGCGRGYEYAPIDPVPTVLKDPPPYPPGHDATGEPTAQGSEAPPPTMGLPTTPAAAADESRSAGQESAPPK